MSYPDHAILKDFMGTLRVARVIGVEPLGYPPMGKPYALKYIHYSETLLLMESSNKILPRYILQSL